VLINSETARGWPFLTYS